jgi:SUZ domain
MPRLSTRPSPGSTSSSDTEERRERERLTFEERQAHYQLARERIFANMPSNKAQLRPSAVPFEPRSVTADSLAAELAVASTASSSTEALPFSHEAPGQPNPSRVANNTPPTAWADVAAPPVATSNSTSAEQPRLHVIAPCLSIVEDTSTLESASSPSSPVSFHAAVSPGSERSCMTTLARQPSDHSPSLSIASSTSTSTTPYIPSIASTQIPPDQVMRFAGPPSTASYDSISRVTPDSPASSVCSSQTASSTNLRGTSTPATLPDPSPLRVSGHTKQSSSASMSSSASDHRSTSFSGTAPSLGTSLPVSTRSSGSVTSSAKSRSTGSTSASSETSSSDRLEREREGEREKLHPSLPAKPTWAMQERPFVGRSASSGSSGSGGKRKIEAGRSWTTVRDDRSAFGGPDDATAPHIPPRPWPAMSPSVTISPHPQAPHVPPYAPPPPAPPPAAVYPPPVNFAYVNQPPPTQYPVAVPPWAYIWDPVLNAYYTQAAYPIGPAYERGGEGEGDYEFDVRRPAPRSMELYDPNKPSGSAPPAATRYYASGDGTPGLRRANSSDAISGGNVMARPVYPGGAVSREDELA